MSKLIENVKEILKGIDEAETDDDDGWWDTYAGAEFGYNKLEDVICAIENHEEQIAEMCRKVAITELHKVIKEESESADPEWPVSSARVESFEYGVNKSIEAINKAFNVQGE